MTEKELLSDPFKNFLNIHNLKYILKNDFKNHSRQSDSGYPDFIIFTKTGWTVCIEFKTPEKLKSKTKGLRLKQIEWKNYLETYRHNYLLTDSFEQAVEFLKRYL